VKCRRFKDLNRRPRFGMRVTVKPLDMHAGRSLLHFVTHTLVMTECPVRMPLAVSNYSAHAASDHAKWWRPISIPLDRDGPSLSPEKEPTLAAKFA
jgi:hypothetical protein